MNKLPDTSKFARTQFRINLVVPYKDKEAAKEMGCRWDPKMKSWYVFLNGSKTIVDYVMWLKPNDKASIQEFIQSTRS